MDRAIGTSARSFAQSFYSISHSDSQGKNAETSKRYPHGIPSNAMWIDDAFKKQLLSECTLNNYSKYHVK